MKRRITSLILIATMILSVTANLPLTSWLVNTDNVVNAAGSDAYYTVLEDEGEFYESKTVYCLYHNVSVGVSGNYGRCPICKNHTCPKCGAALDDYGICSKCGVGRFYSKTPYGEGYFDEYPSYYCDVYYTYDPSTKTLVIDKEGGDGKYGYIRIRAFSPSIEAMEKLANEVESVEINNCINIDSSAFSGCPNLKYVTINKVEGSPETLSTIDTYAFKNCTNLISVTLPDTVNNIGERAFENCTNLETIYTSGDIKKIQKAAFSGCTSLYLSELTISDDTKIADDALGGISVIKLKLNTNECIELSKTGIGNIYEAAIDSNVDTIHTGVFSNTNISFLTFAEGIDTIEPNAFFNAEINYTSLPKSLINLEYAFADSKINEIRFPTGTKEISVGTFMNATIESLILPEGLTKINPEAFYGSTIPVVTLPSSLETICSNAFSIANIDTVIIPDGVKVIEKSAFSSSGIKEIEIPGSVKEIASNTFLNCSELTTVKLNEGITKISDGAFHGTAIKSITIPHSVSEIGINALGGIDEITIPCNTKLTHGHNNILNIDGGIITSSVSGHPTVEKTTIYVAPDSEQEAYFRYFYKNEVDNGTVTIKTVSNDLTHNGEWKVVTPATCKAPGTKSFTCANCGEEVTADIPVLPHTEVKDKAVAATTTKTGLTEGSHCSVCGTVIKAQKVVPTLTPAPTAKPTTKPTATPTKAPNAPTANPTKTPATTVTPNTKPTTAPSGNTTPDTKPTASPADKPSAAPTDNPTTEPTKAPSVDEFAERLYTTCLGRDAEADGKAYWTSELKSGKTGAEVAEGFFFSPEYEGRKLNNKDFIGTLYETFMGRTPADDEVAYWSSEMDNGKIRKDIFDGFVNSPEWANICLTYGILSGGCVKPTFEKEASPAVKAFAERLYTTCLGREAEKEGLEWWAAELANLRQTGTVAAAGFFNSPEFISLNTDDNEYVTRLYKTFMGRDPEEAGFEFWTSELKAGKDRQYVFDGFSVAPEFANLCAEAGIMR